MNAMFYQTYASRMTDQRSVSIPFCVNVLDTGQHLSAVTSLDHRGHQYAKAVEEAYKQSLFGTEILGLFCVFERGLIKWKTAFSH